LHKYILDQSGHLQTITEMKNFVLAQVYQVQGDTKIYQIRLITPSSGLYSLTIGTVDIKSIHSNTSPSSSYQKVSFRISPSVEYEIFVNESDNEAQVDEEKFMLPTTTLTFNKLDMFIIEPKLKSLRLGTPVSFRIKSHTPFEGSIAVVDESKKISKLSCKDNEWQSLITPESTGKLSVVLLAEHEKGNAHTYSWQTIVDYIVHKDNKVE